MRNFNDIKEVLKSSVFKDIGETIETDQQKELPPPPVQKPLEEGTIITLPDFYKIESKEISFIKLIKQRQSRRIYSEASLSLEELSFLLWSCQGIRKETKDNKYTLRTVPSGGARHPFELYAVVLNVEGLKIGIYRYLPLEHKLLYIYTPENLKSQLNEACYGQKFVSNSAVVFMWSVIPYRTEWRYSLASYKLILLDAGHSCQNLYLASEYLNAGTCAIASYDQKLSDELLKLDGEKEFTIYIAPVGKAK